MLSGIIVILGGILAASSFFIAKKPDAKKLIDQLLPYQGWIGIVMFVWGIIDVLNVLRWVSGSPEWIFAFVVSIAELLVGFILGFPLISKYALSKNEQAMKKGEEIRAKLLKIQIPLGFVAIIGGIIYLVLIYT